MTIRTSLERLDGIGHNATFIVQCDSLVELAQVSAKHAHQYLFDSSFCGGTREQLDSVVANGWAEGTAMVERLSATLATQLTPPVSFRRKQRWSDDGDESSWEREQQGHEAIWRQGHRASQRGPAIVRLSAVFGGLGDLRSEQLVWDGVVLVVLCNLLESAGYRVAATMNSVAEGFSREYTVTQVVVKEPQVPLDITSMSALCYPAVFRYHVLAARYEATLSSINGGMASTRELDEVPQVTAICEDNALRLRHCYSEQAALTEIRRVLALFNKEAA